MSKFAGLALKPAGRMMVVHPVTKVPLIDADRRQAYIDLHSADSDVARRWRLALANRRIDAGVSRKQTAEEMEAEQLEFYPAMTTGWYLLDIEGRPIDAPFTPENAADLYREVPWLRDQVDAFIGARANFLKAPSEN